MGIMVNDKPPTVPSSRRVKKTRIPKTRIPKTRLFKAVSRIKVKNLKKKKGKKRKKKRKAPSSPRPIRGKKALGVEKHNPFDLEPVDSEPSEERVSLGIPVDPEQQATKRELFRQLGSVDPELGTARKNLLERVISTATVDTISD